MDAKGIDYGKLDVPGLIELCEDGDERACQELDARGVEAPIMEPSAPPIAVTHWQGQEPFCEACSHFHAPDARCDCPECGKPATEPGSACGRHGG